MNEVFATFIIIGAFLTGPIGWSVIGVIAVGVVIYSSFNDKKLEQVRSELKEKLRRTLCYDCEERTCYEVEREIGIEREGTVVKVTIPVWRCDPCDAEYTDWRAEEIRNG